MANNKPIQLTEQDLHYLVEDAVRSYLIQEGFLSNVWNGAKNVAGGAWDAAKAVGNTAGAMYYNGAANGQIQKLKQMEAQYQQKIQQIEQQIQQLQQQAQTKQQNAQGNIQSFKNRMKPQQYQQQPQGNTTTPQGTAPQTNPSQGGNAVTPQGGQTPLQYLRNG